jgi:hypothetical protein
LRPKLKNDSKKEAEWLGHWEKFNGLFDSFAKSYDDFFMVAKRELSAPTTPNATPLKKDGREKRLIEMRNDGSFAWNGKPIECDPENIYFKIFRILFDECDASGFCSYDKINRNLEKSGEKRIIDTLGVRERVRNALGNFWRYSKLKNKAPDGKKVISTRKGKGLALYNPLI